MRPLPFRLRALTHIVIPFGLLCCAIRAGASEGPQAAASSSADLSTLPFEDLVQVKVVTAASKFEQLISDAPSSVVVLTASDIRDFGWRTLADALATLPGLYVANDRNYSYLGARGFLRPGDYNSRFLLLVDGVRTNDAVYDQALIGTEGLLDMDMVKRIEFVPGPGSAVYGSNALFGVINIVTRDGNGLPGLRAAVAAGSFGERKGRISYGWHDQHGADLLVAATSYARRGQDLYFPEFDTPVQNHGVARGLDGDRAQNVLVKGSYAGFTLMGSWVGRTKGVPTASFNAIFGMPDNTRDSEAVMALSWDGQAAPGVAVSAQLSWGRSDYLGQGYYLHDYVSGAYAPVLNVDGEHGRWHGASVSATITRLPGHKILAGVEAGRDTRRDQFNYDSAPYALLLNDHCTAARAAVFVEDEMRLTNGLLLNAGLRYDHHERPDVVRFSPRVALLDKLTAQDTLKLIYGQAFRAPNAYEMYYAVPGAWGNLPNPGLRPERVATRELVLDHSLARGGHATLALFETAVDGLINQEQTGPYDQLQFRNIDHVRVRGVETAADGQFGVTRVRASYTWQLARGTMGEPLADSPRHLANLNLATPLRWHAARLGSELLCSAARTDERGVAGGFCVTNLTLNVPRALPDADLALSVYNVFDKRYADIAGAAFTQATVARQSRTLYAKLETRF